MRVAQELYEGVKLGEELGGAHGIITYMRTDSLRISDEAAEAAKKYIISKYGEEYYPSRRRFFKTSAEAQDAHEAIRPSDVNLDPDTIKRYLTPDQYKLYKLIFDRFIASQMKNAELDTMSADISSVSDFAVLQPAENIFSGRVNIRSNSKDISVYMPIRTLPKTPKNLQKYAILQ